MRMHLRNAGWVIAGLLLSLPTFARAQAWNGIPANDITALKSSAEKGDPAAMADYAYHSLICLGEVPYNQHLIFRYFTQAHAKGNIAGTAGLAHCYRFSIGTVMDREKSRKFAETAHQQGHPFGAKILASLALSGKLDGGERDWDTWVKLTQESARTGCISARFNLALTHLDGIEGQPDREEGVRRLMEIHNARIFPMATTWLLNDLGRQPIADRDPDLYRECYDMTHHYAELGEPDALHTLGQCYQRAGDEETALAYFFKAAHLGSYKAWERLYILKHEHNQDRGFRSTWRTQGNLAKRAYETGSRLPIIVVQASWEYMRHYKKPEVQAMIPTLQRDLVDALAAGQIAAHDALGQLYDRADPALHPEFARPDLSAAHLIYHLDPTARPTSLLAASLAFPIHGRKDTKENLARALVAAQSAREEGHPDWTRKNWWELLQKKLTPEIRKRAQALKKDGFPHGRKYRLEAAALLKREGQLPEKAVRH